MKLGSLRLSESDASTLATLRDVLNGFLKRIQDALAAVPQRATVSMQFQTGATVANSFPTSISAPGFNPVSVFVGSARNLDDVNASFASAVMVQWEVASNGNIIVRTITGLSANTRYSITLEVFGG